MTIELVVDNSAELRDEGLSWPARARTIRILDDQKYVEAGELLRGIKALRQKIAATFDPHIKRAFDSHRALCKEKQDAEAPLTEAEQILKHGLVAYDREQEERRLLEERRLQDAAREAEEARRLEDAAAMEREATATGNQTLLADAEALIAQPVEAPAVILPRSTPKVAGVVHRENWSARVVDLKKLVAFVSAHPEHLNLLQANQPALNQLARALKGNLKVDGVQAINTPTVAAASR